MKLKANYHTHTLFCDGTASPEDMVKQALRLGFDHLGFSGHVDISPKMDIPAYQKEIRRLAEVYAGQIEILCGGELDSLYPDRHPAGFDYLIGSVHHLRAGGDTPLAVDWDVQMKQLLTEGFGGDGYRLCRAYYRQIAEAYGKGGCTWIGHFDLVTRFNPVWHFVDETDPRYLQPAFEAMDALAEQGLPFEINTKQAASGQVFPGEILLRHLRERGGEILISSDAHRPEDLDQGFEAAAGMVLACGFDHVNILTLENGRPVFHPVPAI